MNHISLAFRIVVGVIFVIGLAISGAGGLLASALTSENQDQIAIRKGGKNVSHYSSRAKQRSLRRIRVIKRKLSSLEKYAFNPNRAGSYTRLKLKKYKKTIVRHRYDIKKLGLKMARAENCIRGANSASSLNYCNTNSETAIKYFSHILDSSYF